MYTCTCVHVYMCTCVYACMCINVHVYFYMSIRVTTAQCSVKCNPAHDDEELPDRAVSTCLQMQRVGFGRVFKNMEVW